MPISNELIDELLKDCHAPQDLLGEGGLLKELTKRLAERVLEAEMTMHLGYEKHAPIGNNSGNSRNGTTSKNVRSVHGAIGLDIPRDRNSTFEPKLISKGEKQFNGFDERIISLYSRGLTVRDIQAHFQEVYGVEVSGTFISQVTNEVMEEVKAWQKRPLEALYPIVYLDCIVKRLNFDYIINMSYSLDFRRKVLAIKKEKGLSIRETAKRFCIGSATVSRWIKQIEPKPAASRSRKIDKSALEKDVREYPDAYQRERAIRFGVCQKAIWQALKKLAITYKKNIQPS